MFPVWVCAENHRSLQTKIGGALRSLEPQMDQIFSQGSMSGAIYLCEPKNSINTCGVTGFPMLCTFPFRLPSSAVHVALDEAACCLTRAISPRLLPRWLTPNLAWEWCQKPRCRLSRVIYFLNFALEILTCPQSSLCVSKNSSWFSTGFSAEANPGSSLRSNSRNYF